ncbi:hypothetical protein [Robbsia sp. KACC 23696]|uniref:hypothetical protein n=1 Tax=Robbsia sp. KACC 23696 TaxID=3149231 RepID=UPI00325C03DA
MFGPRSQRGTVKEAQAFMVAHPDIKWIELFVIDANGVPRGKLLHRDELMAVYESGRPLPSTLFGLTLWGDNVDASGLAWEIGDADVSVYPLQGALWRMPSSRRPLEVDASARAPHARAAIDELTCASVQVALDREGASEMCHADPRYLLTEIIARLQQRGVFPVMAAELEFYPRSYCRCPWRTAARAPRQRSTPRG